MEYAYLSWLAQNTSVLRILCGGDEEIHIPVHTLKLTYNVFLFLASGSSSLEL
jgi:hypothetical protein